MGPVKRSNGRARRGTGFCRCTLPKRSPRATFSASFFPAVATYPNAALTRRVISRAPTRIDLGGGWTDVPPYCEREGGFVCNIAIDRYATASITDDALPADQSPLVLAALRRTGVKASVSMRSDFPVAAGLGGSSAASAAVFSALAEWRRHAWDRKGIAELGRQVEVEDLGIAGGRQDHYAACFGGALALTFTDDTAVRRLRLTDATRAEIAARSLLIYTGESRISGDTITAVLGAYERGERRVTRALGRMKELARGMATSLERGDLDAVGEAMAEHWTHQRSLDPSIPTARIDEIVARARANGAVGAKAMGASGGGCVLVIGRPERMAALTDALRELGDRVAFDVDDHGATIEEQAP